MKENTENDIILTKRELEVLKLISERYTIKEISSILNIGMETVTTYRKNLLKKFSVKNCAELIYKVTKQVLI